MGSWLVTGGAGYIGAHVVRAFCAAGEQCAVIDDLSTGVRQRVSGDVPLYVGDILDPEFVRQVFSENAFVGVVHLAGKKSVPESIQNPGLYESVNVGGTNRLLAMCAEFGVQHFIFSSSAAVYGRTGGDQPLSESTATQPENPYGQSKLDAEHAIEKATTDGSLDAVALRYFNVGGAVDATLADTKGENLIPVIRRAQASHEVVNVFGTDLPTRDGTCVRDYVHVVDIAAAHLAAARYLCSESHDSFNAVNLGTGRGSTVLEVIAAVEGVSGVPVKWAAAAPRLGDPVSSTCDVAKAERLLGWRATHSLESIVAI